MNRIVLSEPEVRSTQGLLQELTSRFQTVEDETFLNDACLYAHELPRRVRAFLNDFKTLEPPAGYCLVSGYPVDEERVGRTPEHWKYRAAVSPALAEEMLLILYGSLLGDMLCWSTQQNGFVVHDVIPIRGHEREQLGSSSDEPLTWHNEDAFHPYRCDYLGMLALRNPDDVPTTVASITPFKLSEEHVRVLFEPRFTIRPDESHLEKNKAALRTKQDMPDEWLTDAYRRINRMNSRPEKLAVLYGDPRAPYVRIDPYFMDPLRDDPEAQSALDALVELIDRRIHDLVLRRGDFVFMDNYRVVHGRRSFRARYDGQDRWLKRISVTRDLRKSREARTSCTSRIIY
ncbi:MAG TPA: guanitoxin biosynthesis L-enduracididine beta-hydroxylase GntD [Pyrinomonadaceae bacterium]|jgi:Fe(II)/alpha-ketoglutarate-dependent arginine beta-hydroxylase